MSEPFKADEIVGAAYRAILTREPDTEGLAMAAAHLRATHDVESILKGLLRSPEFKERLPLFLAQYHPERRLSRDEAGEPTSHPFSDADVLDSQIRSHPGLRGIDMAVLREPVAKLSGPKVFRCSRDEDRAQLYELGVRVHGAVGQGDLLIALDETAHPTALEVRAQGTAGNLIVLGPDCEVFGEIQLGGNDNTVYLSGRRGCPQNMRVSIYGHSSAFVFGQESTAVGASFHVEGPRHYIVVGRDCMMAADVYVAATDNHAVLDSRSGEVLNVGESISIGPHAWLGFGTSVLKGANVGEGAVLAARSLLSSPCPRQTLMAGSPAREIRSGITWDRDFPSAVYERQTSLGLNVEPSMAPGEIGR